MKTAAAPSPECCVEGRVRENLLALFARRGDAAARRELIALFMADIRRCVGAAVGARRVCEFEGAGVAHVLERLGAWDPEARGTAGVSDFAPFALGTLRYRMLDAAQRDGAIGGVWVPRSAWRSEGAAAVRRSVSLDAPVRGRENERGREVADRYVDPLDAMIAKEELERAMDGMDVARMRRCA